MAEFLARYWQLFIPIILIDLGLKCLALIDLYRRNSVLGGKKWPWAIIIVFVNLLGSVVYLVLARKE